MLISEKLVQKLTVHHMIPSSSLVTNQSDTLTNKNIEQMLLTLLS